MSLKIPTGKKRSPLEMESRNKVIKDDYFDLRREGMKKEAACEVLANKYFLSISRINSIIYSK